MVRAHGSDLGPLLCSICIYSLGGQLSSARQSYIPNALTPPLSCAVNSYPIFFPKIPTNLFHSHCQLTDNFASSFPEKIG